MILQTGISIFFGVQKSGFHIDEFFTYSLSNGVGKTREVIQDGKTYSSGSPFKEYFSADEEHPFDYGQVWKNQADDVHPPLYYVLIHTLSSLIPGIFTKWVGLGANIFFSLAVTVLTYFIAKQLSGNRKSALLIAGLYGISPAAINSVMFLRMYILLNIWILAMVLLHLKYFDRKRLDFKFYLGLFFISLLGTMTQYYFLIFIFFLCAWFLMRLSIQKRWKDVLKYVGTMAAAGGASIAIFPAMLEQIFGGGYRGAQSFENLTNSSDMLTRLGAYFVIIKRELFGDRLSTAILLAAIFLILGWGMNRRKGKGTGVTCNYIPKVIGHSGTMLVFTCLCYTLLVAKISPYQTPRYVYCIYPLLFIGFCMILYHGMISVLGNHHLNYIMLLIGMINVFFFFYSFQLGMPNLRLQEKDNIRVAEEHRDEAILCIYDEKPWNLMTNYFEFEKSSSIVFVSKKNMKILPSLEVGNNQKIQLYISDSLDQDKIMKKVMKVYENLSTSSLLYKAASGNVYELS